MNFKNLLIFDPHLSDTKQIFAQAAAERRENLPNIVLKTRIIKSNIDKKRRDKVKRHIKKPTPMPTSAKARISPPAAASKKQEADNAADKRIQNILKKHCVPSSVKAFADRAENIVNKAENAADRQRCQKGDKLRSIINFPHSSPENAGEKSAAPLFGGIHRGINFPLGKQIAACGIEIHYVKPCALYGQSAERRFEQQRFIVKRNNVLYTRKRELFSVLDYYIVIAANNLFHRKHPSIKYIGNVRRLITP